MAENFRQGDRVEWRESRMTTEPEIVRRPRVEIGERVGAEDDHDDPTVTDRR